MTQRLTISRGDRTLYLTDDPHVVGLSVPDSKPVGNVATWAWWIPGSVAFFFLLFAFGS